MRQWLSAQQEEWQHYTVFKLHVAALDWVWWPSRCEDHLKTEHIVFQTTGLTHICMQGHKQETNIFSCVVEVCVGRPDASWNSSLSKLKPEAIRASSVSSVTSQGAEEGRESAQFFASVRNNLGLWFCLFLPFFSSKKTAGVWSIVPQDTF